MNACLILCFVYLIIESSEFVKSQPLYFTEDDTCDRRRDAGIFEKLQTYESKIKAFENQIKTTSVINEDSEGLAGTEFLLVFPPLFHGGLNEYCVLYLVSKSTGLCNVELPLLGVKHNVTLKIGENRLTLPSSYMALENQVEGKVVYIRCDVFVNVYAARHDKYTIIAFFVLPIHSRFHYEYRYIPSVKPLPVANIYKYNSTISIVSSGDNNIVQVYLNIIKDGSDSINSSNLEYSKNESLEFALNRYESIVISYEEDLTGSRISSIDPIFVATGNICGRLNKNNACNGMNIMIPVDNMFQTVTYDKEHDFITPLFYPFLRGYKIRILQMLETKSFRLQYKLGQENKTENLMVRNWFIDIDVDSNIPVYIRTSRFVSVTIITPGKNNTDQIGTAFMLYIPEKDTLLSAYYFVVPDLQTTNYITVISRNVSNIQLNGKFLEGNITVSRDVDSKPYEVKSFPVNSGYYVAQDVSKQVFSLYVYGKQRPNLGYGFAAASFRTDN